jgi:hypothetical protein
MDSRWARRLTALYPAAWRARYGAEFAAFLEEQPSTLGAIADVVTSAIRERVGGSVGLGMDSRQQSLVLMTYAYLAAVAAGVNFYYSVDDTPLATAMRSHPVLLASFLVVARASFVALAAVVAIAIPVTLSMLRDAFTTRRWDVVRHVAVPFGAAATTLAWMAAAGLWAHARWGGPWVPTPWDVVGDWDAPAGWPPLLVRLALSSVTLGLLVAGLVGSAISVGHAIQRSDLSRLRPFWFKATSVALAGAITVMAVGVLGWGWLAEQYEPTAFLARDGLFGLLSLGSWLASAMLFLASAAIAVRGAHAALASRSA